MDSATIPLLSIIANLNDDLIVIFKDENVIFTNSSFNRFFNVFSTEDYNTNFGEFENNFIPHPNYFNKNKITGGENWIDAILKLDEKDRIVSMLSQTYDPKAFSVNIDKSVKEYRVVVFKDITQDLIKRIMIQNHTNIDAKSGAYDRKYFKEIAKSYQEAAVFNEKIVSILSIVITKEDGLVHKDFVNNLLVMIRRDDMLVRWDENRFLLVYMSENSEIANKVLEKFKNIINLNPINKYGCKIELNTQKEKEDIASLIKRL
ncbi:hypothetical protein FJR48_04560 [Sulfurimonas lithotrophica]|uniref:GGDEF domain-containing protein n=1 Tax=Sulfurimonas lithotrophica TaxID=2590022 RepID=A0A5P8NZZ3_9BACT|nr:hypothetical protein [Sulfurimonas lithotrophica]QFR49035.1 hypothetical protein FJR48_04560 [Sulfurimonas lithotrophica]